jgi:uncharacterized protein (TIGR02588 family)
MSQVAEREPAQTPLPRGARAGTRSRRPAGRLVAEWVTMGISAAIILGVAGFLVWQGMNQESVFVPAEVKVRLDQTVQRGGKYVVPVMVENLGRRTLKDFKVRVSFRSESKSRERESDDVVVDFLGERATEVLYVYFERDPRELGVEARVFSYALE